MILGMDDLTKFNKWIRESRRIVVFTGAGFSTESGVSDYRSQGGLWQRYQPVTIQEFCQEPQKRKLFWQRKKEMYAQILKAKPNKGHFALTRLEKQEKMLGIITQNIDGLHQKAGSSRVLELHGTNLEIICLDCKILGPFEPIYEKLEQGEDEFICKSCGGLLKPNTISFGQSLDSFVLEESLLWSRSCDLMIAAGSTLVVEPAASLPRLAKEEGAKLVIINRDPTPLDDWADAVFHASIGKLLDEAIQA